MNTSTLCPASPALQRARPHRPLWAAGLALCLPLAAQAARPLGTEDAGVNEARQCHLETWSEHGPGSHETHLAPACGVGGGLEVVAEWVRPHPGDSSHHARILGLKWAPEWLAWRDWRFGLKLMGEQARDTAAEDTGWHWQGHAWSAIASVPLSPQWTVHANLGQVRSHGPAHTATAYGLALAWTPHTSLLVFGEVLGEGHEPAGRTAGLRWWLIPDTLGLDLTHSRDNGASGSHRTGIGLGWYGLRF